MQLRSFICSVLWNIAIAKEKGQFSVNHCFPVPTPSGAGSNYPSPVANTFQTEAYLSIAPSAADVAPAEEQTKLKKNNTNYTVPDVVIREQPRGVGLMGVGGGGVGGGGDGGGGGGDWFPGHQSRATYFRYWNYNWLSVLDRIVSTIQSTVDHSQIGIAKAAIERMNKIIFGEYVEASDEAIAMNVQFMELNLPNESIDQQTFAVSSIFCPSNSLDCLLIAHNFAIYVMTSPSTKPPSTLPSALPSTLPSKKLSKNPMTCLTM